jgi:adenosine deaminase
VTINTDNRLITDTTVTTELQRAVETFDLDIWQVRQIVINGFKSAFLPFHERQALLRRISEELDHLIDEELRALGHVVEVPMRTLTDGSKRVRPAAVNAS